MRPLFRCFGGLDSSAARRNTWSIPVASPSSAPPTVIHGPVFHHRSRAKPRQAGRANSRPIVVSRVPHSSPVERADRLSGSAVTNLPRLPTRAIESGTINGTRSCRAPDEGRRQEGKPLEASVGVEAGSSPCKFFYTGLRPLSTPQERFEKYFTNSRTCLAEPPALPSLPGPIRA